MTDEELIAAAAEAYSVEKWVNFERDKIFGEDWPIAGTPWDQKATPGIKNPYWEVVRLLPADWDSMYRITARALGMGEVKGKPSPHGFWMGGDAASWRERQELGLMRNELVRRYAWSIPSPKDIVWICDQALSMGYDGILEMGAGTGYWAWQMEQAGLDVAAYDVAPAGAGSYFASHGPYAPILVGGAEKIADHARRALFMSWPTYNDPWAYEALKAYGGDLLIHVGEGPGGCTGNDKFFELLDKEWVHVDTCPFHFSYWGIHCELSTWRRVY